MQYYDLNTQLSLILVRQLFQIAELQGQINQGGRVGRIAQKDLNEAANTLACLCASIANLNEAQVSTIEMDFVNSLITGLHIEQEIIPESEK